MLWTVFSYVPIHRQISISRSASATQRRRRTFDKQKKDFSLSVLRSKNKKQFQSFWQFDDRSNLQCNHSLQRRRRHAYWVPQWISQPFNVRLCHELFWLLSSACSFAEGQPQCRQYVHRPNTSQFVHFVCDGQCFATMQIRQTCHILRTTYISSWHLHQHKPKINSIHGCINSIRIDRASYLFLPPANLSVVNL